MKSKIFLAISLLATFLFGFLAFSPKITGFSISEIPPTPEFKIYIAFFLIAAAFLVKTSATLIREHKDSELEKLAEEIRRRDTTGKHKKNWSVYHGTAEIYASEIPSTYKGLQIPESPKNNPIEKVWLESKRKGEAVSRNDIEEALKEAYLKIAKSGKTLIAPTASRYLSKVSQRLAKEYNIEIEVKSGEEMSNGLFRYLVTDLVARENKNLGHSSHIPRKKSEFSYMIIKPK